MAWTPDDGDRTSQAGFVIDYALIAQVIRWNSETSQFTYEMLASPEEWDTTNVRQITP